MIPKARFAARLFIVIPSFICVLAYSACSQNTIVPDSLAEETASEETLTGMGGADTVLYSENQAETMRRGPDLYYTVYRVKQGDMVGKIAETHGVSQDALISLNRLKNTRTLQIGTLLKIPSLDGILYTVKKGDTPESIADKYRISLEQIAVVNSIPDNTVPEGTILFLPDAKLDWVTLQEINGDLFRKPLRSRYYVSSRYGWRNNPFSGRRTFHNGVDMAASMGTPVYAALDGRVVRTGYDVTYGNFVIIAHHSGYQSMYAHLSSITVSNRAYVSAGTRIGLVGNTGQSTGAHLHFTIYKNRSTINPVTLWN